MAEIRTFKGGLTPPEIFTWYKDREITTDVINKFMLKHQIEKKRYRYLMEMYKGQAEIYSYPDKEAYKPDNRLDVNFAKYITETFLGYFNGIPIKKSHDDDDYDEKINRFDNMNDIEDEESELVRLACIYGRAYELMYQDENTQTNVVYNGPEDMFMVYDDSIKQVPLFAVRYGKDEDGNFYGTLFTREKTCSLVGHEGSVRMAEEWANPYSELPVVEWYLNDNRIGLFEPVVSLINSFNKVLSEKANDVDYFSDSYLKFIGAELDREELNTIRDNRIINYFGGGTEKLDVGFLDKPDSDSQTENLLDRLQDLIFHTSMVANISDENFGTTSGTALAYKLQAMSNLALAVQRKVQSSLNRRYKLFSSLLTNVSASQQDNWSGIRYSFKRNEPRNLLEEAQTATQLMAITSEETALSVLSSVGDVKAELDRKEKEKESAAPLFDIQKG